MFNRIQQSFATQNVHVQMLTAFNADFRLHVYRDFTVFDLAQIAHRNHVIFSKTGFRAQAAGFAFFAIQQPERVQQVVILISLSIISSSAVHVAANVET